MSSIDGRSVVITGAASGIGRAMADGFAAAGARVLLVDLSEDGVAVAVDELARAGHDAAGIAVDITVPNAAARVVDAAKEGSGRIDILCNNAGLLDDFHPVATTTDDLWDRVMAVNLTAPFTICRAALPVMAVQGAGAIVNIASVAGLYGGRAGAAYTVSKHGLIGLTRSIAAHYGQDGIRCNAICPGGVATGLAAHNPSPEGRKVVMRSIATAVRRAEPAEIADVALYVASDDSSILNGAVIVADGGWTAT